MKGEIDKLKQDRKNQAPTVTLKGTSFNTNEGGSG